MPAVLARQCHRGEGRLALISLVLSLIVVMGFSTQPPAAAAQMPSTVQRPSITLEAAQMMIEAAEVEARVIGVPMVIVVVDESGVLKAFGRMDGALLLSVGIAQDKAYTAAAFGAPTHVLYDAVKDQPAILTSVGNIPHFTLIGGGYPIMVGGVIAGAIGVSGGTVEQDRQVAEAALAARRP